MVEPGPDSEDTSTGGGEGDVSGGASAAEADLSGATIASTSPPDPPFCFRRLRLAVRASASPRRAGARGAAARRRAPGAVGAARGVGASARKVTLVDISGVFWQDRMKSCRFSRSRRRSTFVAARFCTRSSRHFSRNESRESRHAIRDATPQSRARARAVRTGGGHSTASRGSPELPRGRDGPAPAPRVARSRRFRVRDHFGVTGRRLLAFRPRERQRRGDVPPPVAPRAIERRRRTRARLGRCLVVASLALARERARDAHAPARRFGGRRVRPRR